MIIYLMSRKLTDLCCLMLKEENKMPIKLGIVGTNFISDRLWHAVQYVPEVEVCAVYSRHQETGDAFAAKYGITQVYTEGVYMKLIGSRKLTWVICGTGVLLALAGVVFLPQMIPVHFANGIADDFENKIEIFFLDTFKKFFDRCTI